MIYYELILGRILEYMEKSTDGTISTAVSRRKVVIEIDTRNGSRNPFDYLFDTAKEVMREEEYLISLKEIKLNIVRDERRF